MQGESAFCGSANGDGRCPALLPAGAPSERHVVGSSTFKSWFFCGTANCFESRPLGLGMLWQLATYSGFPTC